MHIPVLIEEFSQNFKIKKNGIYLDLTVGYGGHASVILKEAREGFLIGIDKDLEALKIAQKNLKKIGDNFKLIWGDFRNLKTLLKDSEFKTFDGIFGDLGVSSPQIDESRRGFSFNKSGPLDMRMDQSQTLTAKHIVNSWEKEQLVTIFEIFESKRYGRRLAEAIIQRRPLETTTDLVEIIRGALPAFLVRRKNPAKVAFLAIRNAVNSELEALKELLESFERLWARDCVIGFITFHSLEDKLVKKFFSQKLALSDNYRRVEPVDYLFRSKTFRASEAEVLSNPRAKSAKLRILYKKTIHKRVKNE